MKNKSQHSKKSDLADPHTGLYPEDVALVKNSWQLLEQTARPFGVAILLQFFESCPQYQRKFARFADASAAQLIGDKQFEAHACYIMHTLAGLVDSIDDQVTLGRLCDEVGARHAAMQVTRAAFWDLKEAIMSVVGETVGEQLRAGAGRVWNIALDHIFTKITEHLGQGESKVQFT